MALNKQRGFFKWLNLSLVACLRGLSLWALLLGFAPNAYAVGYYIDNVTYKNTHYPSAAAACSAVNGTLGSSSTQTTSTCGSVPIRYCNAGGYNVYAWVRFADTTPCPSGKRFDCLTGQCVSDDPLDDCSTSPWGDLSGNNNDDSCDCPADKVFDGFGVCEEPPPPPCEIPESGFMEVVNGSCECGGSTAQLNDVTYCVASGDSPSGGTCPAGTVASCSGSPVVCACNSTGGGTGGTGGDTGGGTGGDTGGGTGGGTGGVTGITTNTTTSTVGDVTTTTTTTNNTINNTTTTVTNVTNNVSNNSTVTNSVTNNTTGGNTTTVTETVHNSTGGTTVTTNTTYTNGGADGNNGGGTGGTGDTGDGGDSETSAKLDDIAAGIGTANDKLNNISGTAGSIFDRLGDISESLTGTVSTPDAADNGEFAEVSQDQENVLRAALDAKYTEISSGISAIFSPPALNGDSGLPCYRNLSLFDDYTFDICLSDYEEEMSIIPAFIYGFGIFLAAFIVIGGAKND